MEEKVRSGKAIKGNVFLKYRKKERKQRRESKLERKKLGKREKPTQITNCVHHNIKNYKGSTITDAEIQSSIFEIMLDNNLTEISFYGMILRIP